MPNIGHFDTKVLRYILDRLAQNADDQTIEAEIMRPDARFLAVENDSQGAEMYIAFAKAAKSHPDIFDREFPCEYVRLEAKLKDGRTFSWTHWVPNKLVDEIFGIAAEKSYLTAEKYAAEKVKSYMKDGIYHLSNGNEEYITADNIQEISTTVDKEHLTVTDIISRDAHLRDAGNITVRPQPEKRISLQRAIDRMDDVLHGRATLNEFFADVRQPKRGEAGANTLLKATAKGYVTASDGKPLDIRPLFHDDVLFMC